MKSTLQISTQIVKETAKRGAAIAQWIHLSLSTGRFGFESQAHHL